MTYSCSPLPLSLRHLRVATGIEAEPSGAVFVNELVTDGQRDDQDIPQRRIVVIDDRDRRCCRIRVLDGEALDETLGGRGGAAHYGDGGRIVAGAVLLAGRGRCASGINVGSGKRQLVAGYSATQLNLYRFRSSV